MIEELSYINRIIECNLFVVRIQRHGLNIAMQKEIAGEMTASFSSYVQETFRNDKLFITPLTAKQKDDMLKKAISTIHIQNLNKVARYMSWVCNYSLVMMCGVFEAFLLDVMKEVLIGDQPESVRHVISDRISDFEKKSLPDKLKDYSDILGINQTQFFDFSSFTKEIQSQYRGFKQKDLQDIFEKRNQAAHTDEPIVSTDDLSEISDIFQKLVFNVGSKIHKSYGIPTQLSDMFKGIAFK